MLRIIIGFALLILSMSSQAAGVKASDIHFGPGGKYHGYLVRPDGEGRHPGIVVIHEWWGLTDDIRNQTAQLAKSGYVALAVDLFGKSTKDPQEAMKMVRGLDQKAATAQLLAATHYLRSQAFVRSDRIGSIGWCFGGAQSLNLAINDPKLTAAVIYYGRLITDPKKLVKIRAAILGVFGEADESIPMDQVRKFQKALSEVKVVHEIHTYTGAGHAFANPTGGERYKPDAAKDAWEKTLDFLERYLKR